MEIIKIVIASLVFGVLVKEVADIKKHLFSIEARLRDKVDKPTDLEKLMEERRKQPTLTKEELDKIMTPEEKEARKKLYGSEYPIAK